MKQRLLCQALYFICYLLLREQTALGMVSPRVEYINPDVCATRASTQIFDRRQLAWGAAVSRPQVSNLLTTPDGVLSLPVSNEETGEHSRVRKAWGVRERLKPVA